jgi:hypothetical protein
MIERNVRGNRISIQGTKCEVRIWTFQQAKVLIELVGNDSGELGRIPFDELNHHLRLAGKLELFIDTSRATGVSIPVTEQWEKWFAAHRQDLRGVHLFASNKYFLIMAGMIKEISRLGDLFHIYAERESFQNALGFSPDKESMEPSITTSLSDRELQLKGTLSTFRFIRLRPGVLFVKISGRDTGEQLEQVLSTLTAEINAFPGPLQLFVDASETLGIIPEVRDKWTRWIAENRNRLLNVDVLTSSRFVTLVVSAAKIFSRTGELMTVLDQRQEFLQRMEAAAPGSQNRILGIGTIT